VSPNTITRVSWYAVLNSGVFAVAAVAPSSLGKNHGQDRLSSIALQSDNRRAGSICSHMTFCGTSAITGSIARSGGSGEGWTEKPTVRSFNAPDWESHLCGDRPTNQSAHEQGFFAMLATWGCACVLHSPRSKNFESFGTFPTDVHSEICAATETEKCAVARKASSLGQMSGNALCKLRCWVESATTCRLASCSLQQGDA
jgi:hypothetical protein